MITKRGYEKIKKASRKRQAALSLAGRDIGDIPKVKNVRRRNKCRSSLRLFIETYFKSKTKFYLPWSPDHLVVLERAETCITEGGQFALAMPRGSGKTSICERAILWAALYGYRRFIVAIGDGEAAASEILDTVKNEIETNVKLAEDFPEVCFPVAKLDRIVQRCKGQLCNGTPTRMSWGKGKIILPTIKGSLSSGTVIASVGITGRIRGMKASTADGSDIRPDLVLIDDPQNDESAASVEQNAKRLRILRGAILGLAGPGKKIAAIMPCTVIRPGDMADRILDPEESPDWNGVRFKLVHQFPTNKELWQKFAEIRAEGYRQGLKNKPATDFYKSHRAAMDEGAVMAWPERYDFGISAVQFAMELMIKNRETFYAEYQNEPITEEAGDMENITVEDVFAKINSRKRFEVPLNCTRLTAFIDVQQNLLYYAVCAFSDNWTSYLIDYNAFPDQKRRYFTLKDAINKYPDLYPNAGFDASLIAALNDLTELILSKSYRREDGADMHVERCLIDSAWGKSTATVHNFARQSKFASVVLPSRGVGIGPDNKPYSEYRRNAGDSIGDFWMIPNVRRRRSTRVIEYDTNFTKTLFKNRLLTKIGDPGDFSIFGNPKDIEQHRMLAEQLSAEFSTPTTGRSRRVDVWKLYPGRDNHLLDCVVGCFVAASERGLKLENIGYGSHAIKTSAGTPNGRRKVLLPGEKI